MADIRYTTAVLDNFNRPNEDPVLPPWKTDVGQTMKIQGNQFWGKSFPTQANIAYWSTESFDGDMECWGKIGFPGPPIGSGWRLGLCVAGPDFMGYEVLMHNGVGPDGWTIRRYNPGAGSFTNLASALTSLPSTNHLVLMQLVGTAINCYVSTDNGANWTLKVSANENTYRTNLYGFLGTTGTEISWNDFGGGIPRELRHRPQMYRWIPGQPTNVP
jgi:hypothetical protein